MKKEYTVQDVLNNNEEEIVDLLNKYSRIVKGKDKKIEELRELMGEIRLKAPVNSDIFWLLDRVRL
jgi:hypothetical protein